MKKAQEKYDMTPLPIAKNDMEIFKDQVFCTKDFYDKKTLVLFIHDAPDVIMGPNALASTKMDLSDAFLVIPVGKVIDDSSIRQIIIMSGLPRWGTD